MITCPQCNGSGRIEPAENSRSLNEISSPELTELLERAPEWARFWAVDFAGRAYWYAREPAPGEIAFHAVHGSMSQFDQHLPPVDDWQNTLTRIRP